MYPRFVPSFARTAAPLTSLLRKGQPANLVSFAEDQKESFEKLKKAIPSPPILRLSRSHLQFTADTDACDYQVGCALLQLHEDGVLRRFP